MVGKWRATRCPICRYRFLSFQPFISKIFIVYKDEKLAELKSEAEAENEPSKVSPNTLWFGTIITTCVISSLWKIRRALVVLTGTKVQTKNQHIWVKFIKLPRLDSAFHIVYTILDIKFCRTRRMVPSMLTIAKRIRYSSHKHFGALICIRCASFRRFRSGPLISLPRPWDWGFPSKPDYICGKLITSREGFLMSFPTQTLRDKWKRSTTSCTISFHSVMAPTPTIPVNRCSGGVKHPNSPTSPQARFFAMGPITLYPTTSLTVRRCSVVSGCSYIIVFIAGNMYVGVWGDNARSREV